MRLIDADALILALETQDYSGAPDTLEDWTPQDMTKAEIADIKHAPTIDAVVVVKCKNCLRCCYDELFDEYWCRGRRVTPEWFCGDGKTIGDAEVKMRWIE